MPAGALIKAYPVIVGDDDLRLVLVRGDHRVNDIKLGNALGAAFRPAHESEFAERIGPAGYIGPVGTDVPILLDSALDGASYISGANKADAHLRGVKPGRDFPFTEVDVRTVEAGDTVDGHPIRIEPAIEIGNIFKLGTRYSVPLGATYLDEDGRRSRSGWAPTGSARRASRPPRSSSSPTRRASPGRARWRRSTSTWSRLGKPGTDEFAAAEKLYEELRATGLDIIFDDRDARHRREVRRRRAARRAAAADGRPAHARVGRGRGAGPARAREPLASPGGCGPGGRGPVGDAPVKRKLTFRRLSGLDRSGPPPPETVAGAPLRPWTIPNFIGYVRLALIPVFLVLALNSESGTDALPAVLFAVIGWSDYLDGIAARVTGQYSRMGALLDPLVDRMLVIAGVIVCWKFELLPRWALALLAARELFMLVLARYALHRKSRPQDQLARPLGRLAGLQRAVLRPVRSALVGPGVLVCGARPHVGGDGPIRARWSRAGTTARLDLSLMNAMLRHPSRRL